jgi:hypothetical protein
MTKRPFFLLKSDATLLNLSLQSLNLWSFLELSRRDGYQDLPPNDLLISNGVVGWSLCYYEAGEIHATPALAEADNNKQTGP